MTITLLPETPIMVPDFWELSTLDLTTMFEPTIVESDACVIAFCGIFIYFLMIE